MKKELSYGLIVDTLNTLHREMQKQNTGRSSVLKLKKHFQNAGLMPQREILEFSMEAPSKEIAEILKLSRGDNIYRVKIRCCHRTLKYIEECFFPAGLFSDLSIKVLLESKYQYITQTKKLVIKNSLVAIESVVLDIETANVLEVKQSMPAYGTKVINFLDDGTIVEYAETVEIFNINMDIKMSDSFNVFYLDEDKTVDKKGR